MKRAPLHPAHPLAAGLVALLLAFPRTGAAPHLPVPITEAARLLASQPWCAEIEGELRIGDAPATRDRFSLCFDPAGVVRLRLGMLHIEAAPGRFAAIHRWNPRAVYRAEHPGATIAEVLAAELPPLWCPWLAIALAEGDPGAWPVIADRTGRRVMFDEQGSGSGSGPYTGSGFSGRLLGVDGEASITIRDLTARPENTIAEETTPDGVRAMLPRITGYRLELTTPPVTTLDFAFRPREPGVFPALMLDDREPTPSIADLSPPPPELAVADRLPAISLSVIAGDDLAERSWRPIEAFAAGPGRRPSALVLVLITPSPDAGAILERSAETVRAARLLPSWEGRAPPFIARPVLCAAIEDLDRAAIRRLAEAWRASYRPDPALPEAEALAPELAWLPPAHLLRRVASTADAAFVVIDRAAWIVGVHPASATPEELAESIRAASR